MNWSQIHTGLCVLDACDISKVGGVWNSKTSHTVSVSPLLHHKHML